MKAVGYNEEHNDRGNHRDPANEMKRKLSEQFATAARLYAEAVAVFTGSPLTVSQDEYHRLRKAAEAARGHAEAIGAAFEEHLESQWRKGEPFLVQPKMTKAQGA